MHKPPPYSCGGFCGHAWISDARAVCVCVCGGGGIDRETGYVDVDDDARSYFSPRIGSAIGADISFPMVCARRSLNKSPVRFLSRQALLFKANEVIVPTVMHAASNSSRSRHCRNRPMEKNCRRSIRLILQMEYNFLKVTKRYPRIGTNVNLLLRGAAAQ